MRQEKQEKNGTRVIYTAHGFHFYKGAPFKNWIIYYPIEKICSRWTDTLITINQEDYERAKRKLIKAKEIKLLHGVGINTERFDIEITDEDKQKIRKKIGVTENDIILSYVAELNNNKNQILLINVMEELLKENNKYKLLLIGDGPNMEKYKKEIKDRNLIENVFLLGKRKDIPQLLSITDIYVASSIREGLPVNIMEAMYTGLPIVATNNRGHRELIKDNVNGYIINDCIDYKSFANKIFNLNKNKSQIFIYNSKELIKGYKINNVIEKIKEIYMNKIKVLHLLSTNEFSGAENVACQIIEMLSEDKRIEMYYCSPEGKIKLVLKEKKISYIPIKRISIFNLKKIVNKYNVDIIHAHDVRASVIASFIKNKKIISHIHGNHLFMRKKTIKSILYNIRLKKFNHVLWVSESALDDYFYKNNIKNISDVLPNVINEKEIRKKMMEDINDYNYEVVFIGRLMEAKNPERLIEILKRVIDYRPQTTCAIVGDGVLKEKIKDLINYYEINNNVHLLGFMNNPLKILSQAKVFVMTSRHEGLPMVILEAMALNIPIVSTPTDGISKIITDGYNGFLSEKDDEIINDILSMINDKQRSYLIKENEKKEFHKINNQDKYKKCIKEYYLN